MLCMVPLETTLECPEVGLNDNLQPFSIKGTPAEIFRPPIFANTIFSQSSNLGGGACYPLLKVGGSLPILKVGRLLDPFGVWGLLPPLFGLGGLLVPILGSDGCQPMWGVVRPIFSIGGLLAAFGGWELVVCTSPISFRVCIFHNKKIHIYLIY